MRQESQLTRRLSSMTYWGMCPCNIGKSWDLSRKNFFPYSPSLRFTRVELSLVSNMLLLQNTNQGISLLPLLTSLYFSLICRVSFQRFSFTSFIPVFRFQRLLHIKGKAEISVRQVDLDARSLNDGDVFILDCGLKVQIFFAGFLTSHVNCCLVSAFSVEWATLEPRGAPESRRAHQDS